VSSSRQRSATVTRPETRCRFSLLIAGILTALLLHAPLLSSCAYRTPPDVVEVPPGEYPFFVDEGGVDGLLGAVVRHLAVVGRDRNRNASSMVDGISADDLAQSLATFKTLIEQNPDPVALNRMIREHFRIFQSTGRNEAQDMLVTGYYEPLFPGSLSKVEPFIHPLYRVPESLVQQSGKRIGRADAEGRLVPYWSRQEIDGEHMLKGAELVYLKDRFDAYLLHIQGSGRIQLPDGSVRSVQYAASNGLAYQSLGKLFVDEGIMPAAEVSIDSIRTWFAKHPEQIERMLYHNPRYIFFQWGDDQGPRGSLGQVLTANRSIAIDHDVLPAGAVAYLVSRIPILDADGGISHWRPFGRFVLPQDSGAAIRGAGRVDLFMGSGDYAAKAAGTMKEPGKLYFLLPKKKS
jgi:membrane-bound lytic murein transglycosylase A